MNGSEIKDYVFIIGVVKYICITNISLSISSNNVKCHGPTGRRQRFQSFYISELAKQLPQQRLPEVYHLLNSRHCGQAEGIGS